MLRCRLAVLAVTLTGSGWANVWAGTAEVTITSTPSNVFTPQIVTVRIGDPVRWTNVGGIHNVFSDDGSSFTSGSPASVPGQSGTVTITHDGRYGGLSGKAVALEPATGFTFDTPVLPRPY